MSAKQIIAQRARDIPAFQVMDILARARALEAAGRSIIHMEIGEPDAATSAPIVEAGIAALRAGFTHYTPALGLPNLRAAIAEFYLSRYGVTVNPERVIVTTGSSAALLLAIGVLINPGDEVLLTDPGYPCNRNFLRFVDAHACAVPVGPETRYQMSPAHIAQHWTPRTRAALIASPANPTGMVLALPELQALYAAISGRVGHLIVDEIYHGLSYEGPCQTALAISDEIFVINSFSKFFGMTGWRLGWMIVPETYVPYIDKLAQNIFLAPPTPAQHAALAAFLPETLAILEQRRREFQTRRDFLLPALRDIGLEIKSTPQGAFYIYASCEKLSRDSQRLAQDLLQQAGVAVTPGADFGSHAANTHLRFAYTTPISQLEEGVSRIRKFLRATA